MLTGIVGLALVGMGAYAFVRAQDDPPPAEPATTTAPDADRPAGTGTGSGPAGPTTADTSSTGGGRSAGPTSRPPATPTDPSSGAETASLQVRFDEGGQVTIDGRAADASSAPVEVVLAPGVTGLDFVNDPPSGFVVEIGDAAGDERVALPAALGGAVLDLAGVDTGELGAGGVLRRAADLRGRRHRRTGLLPASGAGRRALLQPAGALSRCTMSSATAVWAAAAWWSPAAVANSARTSSAGPYVQVPAHSMRPAWGPSRS